MMKRKQYINNSDVGLPALTTLYLKHCKLHQTDWVLPSLITLTLDTVEISSKNPNKTNRLREKVKLGYYNGLMFMFLGLSKAKILTLDLDTLKALFAISDHLKCSLSPFGNLKYVKLPDRYEELGFPETIKNYLLGGSQGATIITTLSQNDVNPQIAPVPLTPQHIDDKVTQVGALVQGSGGPVPNVKGACNNSAISSGGNIDIGLWKGHEVNSEFVDLLDLILKKYPETFEHFAAKSKTLCTMKLNMLCTSVNAFASTPMAEIDTEMITEYRTLFAYLQSSFNVNWLLGRLNYIEQLHLSQHELPAVDSCIDEAFRTLDAKLAAGAVYIGDGLLSDP